MTREEAVQTIKDLIWMNGFEPEMNERFSPLPFIKGMSDLYIDVSIRERVDLEHCDFQNRVAAYRIEVSSSVRKMGGNPTPEELLDAADQIRRGAELTMNLQKENLTYLVQE